MRHIIGVILVLVVGLQTVGLTSKIHPVSATIQKQNPLRQAAIKSGLGDPGEKVLSAVSLVSGRTGLSQEFLLAFAYSESCFKLKSVSSKGYNGLYQIPEKVYLAEANAMIGIEKYYMEKLVLANGDHRKAIILYKGWKLDDPEGKRQADKVIALARKLKEG